MNNQLISILLFCFIALLFAGCAQKKELSNGTVTISLTDKRTEDILLFRQNILTGKYDTLSFVTTDSLGKATVKFTVSAPTFAYFLINDHYLPVYLSPTDDLQLILDAEKLPLFKGNGAEVANYLAYTNNLREKFEMMDGKYFFQLKPGDFLNRLDSLQEAFSQFHIAYSDSVRIPENIRILLEKRNEMLLLYKLQNYAITLEENTLDTNSLPRRLRNITTKIPLENSLVNAEIPEYFDILQAYMLSKFHNSFYLNKSKEEINTVKERLPVLADKAIRKENFPKKVEEWLLANNISNNLAFEGITPPLDSVYTVFQNVC